MHFCPPGDPPCKLLKKAFRAQRKVFLKYPDKVQFTYKNWRKSILWPIWVMRISGRQPLKLYEDILNWFNAQHHTNINPTVAQILLNFCQLLPVSKSFLFRKISLLLQHVKQYIYANKSLNKNLDRAECISKLERTWKINKIV